MVTDFCIDAFHLMTLDLNWVEEVVEQENGLAFKLSVSEYDRECELKEEKGSREKRNLRSDLRTQPPVVPADACANVAFEHSPTVHIL